MRAPGGAAETALRASVGKQLKACGETRSGMEFCNPLMSCHPKFSDFWLHQGAKGPCQHHMELLPAELYVNSQNTPQALALHSLCILLPASRICLIQMRSCTAALQQTNPGMLQCPSTTQPREPRAVIGDGRSMGRIPRGMAVPPSTHCPREVCTSSVMSVEVAGQTQLRASMAYLHSSSQTT